MTKSTLSLLVLGTSLWLASPAHAQTLPDMSGVCAPEANPRRARIEYQGHEGLWIDSDVVRCMTARLRTIPGLLLTIEGHDRRAAMDDRRVARLLGAIELGERIELRLETALGAATRREAAAVARLHAWHRSPALWVAVGGVLVGAIVAVTGYALDAVSP